MQALQKTLVAEMRGRIKEDDSGVPEPDGPFAYLWKYRQGGQHELIGRTPRDGGDARIILDGDALAKATEYFNFGETQHSPDHRLEAWSADLRGSEYFTIRVRSWQSGEDLPDIVEQTGGNVVWGRDIDVLPLCPPRREPPAAAGLPPSPGHGAERRRAGLRGKGQRLVHARRGKRERPLRHRRHRQPGDLRSAG